MKAKKKDILAISLKRVTKKYLIHHEKPTFFERLLNMHRNEIFTSLNSVSLDIKKGDKVGIIGSNGAGKTTLLKVIAGITTPSLGQVKTTGRIGSLIDLSAGFHPDLSGKENIFLNGLLLGMSKPEIKDKLQDIIAFADIGSFIDAPFYTYSDGMKLRLGFSIAVHADPDILILDEGITAGDADFQQKSMKKIEEFFKAKKTILVVTHWLDFLEKNVNKIVWVENGKIKMQGTVKVLQKYRKAVGAV